MSNSVKSPKSTPRATSKNNITKKLQIKVIMPEENNKLFSDLIGNSDVSTELESVAKYLKSQKVQQADTDSDASTHSSSKGYNHGFLMWGQEGIGKSFAICAFAKVLELPVVVINCERLLKNYTETVIDKLLTYLESFESCVVHFKDVNYASSLEDSAQNTFYSTLCDIKTSFPDSYFFATASETAEYPPFFYSKDGFHNCYPFNPPELKDRIALIEKFLEEYPHEEKMNLEKLAKDFLGATAGDIKEILSKTFYANCVFKGKTIITYKDIKAQIDDEESGKKLSNMTEKEMRITACHEAGHVVVGYFGTPDGKDRVGKVEVIKRSETLGLTEYESDEEKLSIMKEDLIGRIKTCYGGKCAEQLVYNTSTTGVSGDLAKATAYAQVMVKNCGMDSAFGPVFLHEDVFESPILADKADIIIQEMLKRLEHETTELLVEKRAYLDAITEWLVKKESLTKEELLRILKSKNPKSIKLD